MSRETGIEWTDATWNPIRGCSRVSEGCRHCYAETVANRFCGPGSPYEGVVQIGADGKGNGKWNGQIKFVEKHLLDPLRWRVPQRIFVNSMSDLFHENVTDAMLDQIFAVMALCPQHTFQVLTKRPERMLGYLAARTASRWPLEVAICTMLKDRPSKGLTAAAERTSAVVDAAAPDGSGFVRVWPLPNVWLGVSVEDQKAADARIPLLLQTPAAVRFISAEPLLGPVQLLWCDGRRGSWGGADEPPLTGREPTDEQMKDLHFIRHGGSRLDWVICGGESGSAAGVRPMHPDWARGLRDQCVAAGVPFFFKQWGEWYGYTGAWGDTDIWESTGRGILWPIHVWPEHRPPTFVPRTKAIAPDETCADSDFTFTRNDVASTRCGKKAAGRLLDGVEWNQMPEVRA